jgi:hypothetical protein
LLVKSPPGRQYYEGEFDPENANPPVCLSYDGVTPEPTGSKIQAKTCAECEKSKWGSSASKLTGQPIPACRQHKELVIKIIGIDGAWLFRIPPASIRRHWSPLVDQIKRAAAKEEASTGKSTLTLMTCVIEAQFDDSTMGVINFRPAGYLPEKERRLVINLHDDREALMRMVWGPDGSKRAEQWTSGAKPSQPAPAPSPLAASTSATIEPPRRSRRHQAETAPVDAKPEEKITNQVDDVLDAMGIGEV